MIKTKYERFQELNTKIDNESMKVNILNNASKLFEKIDSKGYDFGKFVADISHGNGWKIAFIKKIMLMFETGNKYTLVIHGQSGPTGKSTFVKLISALYPNVTALEPGEVVTDMVVGECGQLVILELSNYISEIKDIEENMDLKLMSNYDSIMHWIYSVGQ